MADEPEVAAEAAEATVEPDPESVRADDRRAGTADSAEAETASGDDA